MTLFRQFTRYLPGAFILRLKKRPSPSRNPAIIEREAKRPGNNSSNGNRRFAERALFHGRTFGEIPPRNMTGGEFGDRAFFDVVCFSLLSSHPGVALEQGVRIHHVITIACFWLFSLGGKR